VDKIIYRGQTTEEIRDFAELGNQNFNLAKKYYSLTNNHLAMMTTIIFAVVLLSLYYLIRLVFKKQIDPTLFIGSFTILLLYREKVSSIIELLPNLVDFVGRCENVLQHFQHVNDHYEKKDGERVTTELEFKEIQFHFVSYKYGPSQPNVFENRNYFLKTSDQNIIGITGRSGNGKSTFIKLLLRMYECNSGKITIDGVDIKTLDPDYIRREITYVNQTSKLFDRKVVDNMLYGCTNREVCDHFLEVVMQYPNVAKLYQNTDIHNKQAGLLGENLSGGQRQIVNMIGGLINPSKILVLDEPTNALDPALKAEILSLIQDFRKYKQAIIIITHDKDVFPLFNQQIHM
jgi:ABC-type bacteriocin/lantibiotic exporter with double-glycine peptidase domain